MSRKHNTRHPDRSVSHYGDRLTKRGLSKAPAMEPMEVLEKRQERRISEACTVVHAHDHGIWLDHEGNRTDTCNGDPWWTSRYDEIQDNLPGEDYASRS